ncbi:50S ribosomal protein L2 [Candidatus Saccharibacteria bacterium CPR2]|nr:50S ribosomal protein L2 [Candidatus Saccharibacteria bacterium CPR2]
MAVKTYKPVTPARRGMTTPSTDEITTKKPLRSLIVAKKRLSGRNNQGRITVRHRGGGAKSYYRLVDFKLNDSFEGIIEHIEYDPGRSAHIARVKGKDDKHRYILAGNNMKIGQKIHGGNEAPISSHNRMPLEKIPVGSFIYNIELSKNRGGQLARSAGAYAQLMAKEGSYANVRLPSGEVRLVNLACYATIGSVGNVSHQNVKIGSAGRKRRMGRRPQVRGKVMNAVDHPHGGGDGGAHGVGRNPKTPWGQKALGYKTRRRKSSNKLIVRSRHMSKRK